MDTDDLTPDDAESVTVEIGRRKPYKELRLDEPGIWTWKSIIKIAKAQGVAISAKSIISGEFFQSLIALAISEPGQVLGAFLENAENLSASGAKTSADFRAWIDDQTKVSQVISMFAALKKMPLAEQVKNLFGTLPTAQAVAQAITEPTQEAPPST